ncbi:hypothetical protein SmJEL517_g03755 [Synchytrium microbalum]|uniref:SET domain-containing protein n=1 Tax=Synchytrium microbalum TaxID=1806994 RepID=A0A507C735_9FUNG|nr:uncharacterized protein SmJEL517_g03755 [Synchytrium microbalum]TPX33343.1 hypothetical protein SmJEL517_g03755 [Synchytrium microbalum]
MPTSGVRLHFGSTLQVKHESGSYTSSIVNLLPLKEGDVIGSFEHTMSISDVKRYSTVQIDTDKHIELNSELVYINHSCNPNVKFDTQGLKVVALKDMPAGTELAFFYPSTEWEMIQPFECAKHLETNVLKQFILSEHITRMLEERDAAKSDA